jgi:hypothetical protein
MPGFAVSLCHMVLDAIQALLEGTMPRLLGWEDKIPTFDRNMHDLHDAI